MLAELAVWLATPVPWRHRRLGLLGDSVRLWSRGRRRAADWADHEQRCHAVVRAAMAGLARHDTVVVLGSGLARDVPLADLSRRFRRVILVDAVHLAPLRLRVARRRNIVLLTRDLTGLIGVLFGDAAGRAAPLADLQADPAIDLVISANVLSQLALPVEDWAERLNAALPDQVERRIIGWHLADLAGFAARVCLLTDIAYTDGRSSARHDLLWGQALPPPDATWDWPVAPPGEMPGGGWQTHAACGYADLAAAMARVRT